MASRTSSASTAVPTPAATGTQTPEHVDLEKHGGKPLEKPGLSSNEAGTHRRTAFAHQPDLDNNGDSTDTPDQPGTAYSTRPNSTYGNKSARTPSFTVDEAQYGTPWSKRSAMYQFMPFRGMFYDVRGRLPFYLRDWTDGFRPMNLYRVVASAIRMYFIKCVILGFGEKRAKFYRS